MSRFGIRRSVVAGMVATLALSFLPVIGSTGPTAAASAQPATGIHADDRADPAAAPAATSAATLPGVRAVDEGRFFSCALRADGTITCWGDPSGGLTAPPSGTFTSISLGMYYGCGLRTDATIACWGSPDYGLTSPPPGTFAAISAGGFHACALDAVGEITCWGDTNYGQTTAPTGAFESLATGLNHSCAIAAGGAVTCWGDGYFGQTTPPPGTYTAVSPGGFHTCALKTDKTIACWGRADYGQTTAPSGAFSAVDAGWLQTCAIRPDGTLACWGDWPANIAPTGTFAQVASGHGSHSCAIRTSGWVVCWGDTTFNQTKLAPGLTPMVSAGYFHTCALESDGGIACWGGTEPATTAVPAGSYLTVSAGQEFSCAITTAGALRCWGDDRYGLTAPPSGTFTAVSSGGNHACAIRSDGTLACWGHDGYDQASPPAGTFTAVGSGLRHSCAIASAGAVVCWGSDEDGQASPPTGASPWYTAIGVGGWHACAIDAWGAIDCWGFAAEDGRLDPPEGEFAAVSGGYWHNCARRTDGTLACWGEGSDRQTKAPSGSFVDVSAGGWHSCAVDRNGVPTCWGWNYFNQATTAAPAATTYVPVAPTRLLDSRSGNGLSGAFKAGVPRTFQVAGRGPIPSDAVAVTGNFTVTRQTKNGYASLTPVATSTPTTSTLNFPKGDNRANNVTVALGAGGKLSAVYKASAGETAHFLFDVTGYFLADDGGATYNAVAPVRLLDTRAANGLSGRFATGSPRTWQIAGRGSIPAAAIAVTANLTVTGQTSGGYVSLGPVATATPTTSTLNFPKGDTRANGLTVKLAADGRLSAVFKGAAGSTTNLVLDVTGYYLADLTGARFYPLTPDRVLDTRDDIGIEGAFKAGAAQSLVVAPRVGIPDDAVGLAGNLTVVKQTNKGYISLTKAATASPTTSTLNFPVGDTRANGVTGPIASAGTVGLVYKASSGATTHLILDITGYFR